MSLQTKLNSLISSINNITGEEQTDLTSAIQDLVDNQPSGSINITENGTYDVSQKASAVVNVGVDSIVVCQSSDRIFSLSNGYKVAYTTYGLAKLLNQDNSNFIFNAYSAQTSWRIIYKFKMNSSLNMWTHIFGLNTDDDSDYGALAGVRIADYKLYAGANSTSTIYFSNTFSPDTWYYLTIYYDKVNSMSYYTMYDEQGIVIEQLSTTPTPMLNNTSYYCIAGGDGRNTSRFLKGAINLNEVYYEIDGVASWGKTNSKTQNMGIV